MENTLKRLLELVQNGTVEARCAALLVLGALKIDAAEVIKIAGALLQEPNVVLKDYALRYFESVRYTSAVPLLTPLLEDQDREIGERAVTLLSAAGQAAVAPVLDRVATASRAGLLNGARVLCAVRSQAALKGLLEMLRSGSDELNKSVCDLMAPALRELDDKDQERFFNEVETFASKLDPNRERPAAVSAMRLLGQLGRPEARRWLFKYVGAEYHHALRAHALVALLRCLREQNLRKEECAKLFAILVEAEFTEVARLALDLLDAHELPDDVRSRLHQLLESRHPEVQNFALRKMGDFSTPATVRTLIDQLGDPDYRKRDVAARSLRKIPEARGALIKELLACDDPSKAWSIAELLPSFHGKWRRDTLAALWKRLQAAVGAEERIQTALLQVLKQADADYTYEQLADEGARQAAAKKYKEASAYLAPLKDFSEFKVEDKFRLALAQLKLHVLTVANNRQHPALELLADLYRHSTCPVLESLKKEKSLEAQDLFALGFRLAERQGAERDLGKELLEHVAGKFPRNKIGKSAKNKLKLITW